MRGDRFSPGATRALLCLTLLLALLLATLTAMNRLGADRWWFGALNSYLPQAVWGVPGLLLTAALAVTNRRLVWLPLLCVLWVAGPLMGLCWSRQNPPAPGQPSLRVMTWNVKQGARDLRALFAEIDRNRPDLVMLQEANLLPAPSAGDFFRGWAIRQEGQFLVASRVPLEEDRTEQLNTPGMAGRQEFQSCRVRLGGTVITLYNVHLQSPREALAHVPGALRGTTAWEDVATRLAVNATSRYLQAEELATVIRREAGPVIVAGDLNSPDSSLVGTTLRAVGLHDAFAEGGRGYGYSYGHFVRLCRFPLPRFSFIRIDHIMPSSHLRAVRCRTGTASASDHRPVIADLVLQR